MELSNNILHQALFFLLVVCFTALDGAAQIKPDWREVSTVDEVCEAYPELMTKMLEAFDLNINGLEKVKQAYEEDNLSLACSALLYYYENSDNAPHLRKEQPGETNVTAAAADTILNNVFTIQNVRGQVLYGDDGHRDWYYKGPNNDREWAWLSNRHNQISTVLATYFETGNSTYAEYIDLFLRDFIIKSMPYPGVKTRNSVWRGLEVAARAKVWSRIFYNLINSDYLSPATRLLMLSSLPDHAHYNRNFHGGNNWLTMEISALATVAANFPEYKNSEEWFDYSVDAMVTSMKDQVYADGVQTELTSHYHNVSLRNFELFKNICDNANKTLPDFYNRTIESMYSYIAHATRPDGYRILNNDGDRGSDRKLILNGAKKFDNTEWQYIATNGKSGTKPLKGPSWFYPWAGQLVSRSGYNSDAHWSFFDVGPWGSGHQHNDKLHLSISAYGHDLLVDAGRFAYTGEVAKKYRGYARSTQAHNSVLIDGKGQQPDVRVVEKPLSSNHYKITAEFDYAWNSFDKYHDIENVRHTRSLLYVRNHFWIVVDKINTDKPRKIETIWHWHPQCDVQISNKSVVGSNNERANLQIIPVGVEDWNIQFIKGQEVPEVQGWYSVEYNRFEPNTVSIYSTTIESDQTFVWLILPFESKASKVKILDYSLTEDGVNLKLTNVANGVWNAFIPYSDSQGANIVYKD